MIFSVGHIPAQDLAIISSCNHVVMSVGTFGWWGSFLNMQGGHTIYYSKPDSDWENKKIIPDDHFPPNWVGISPQMIPSKFDARSLLTK
jgi:galactoside 2-L-fucosyltransferase 1/2